MNRLTGVTVGGQTYTYGYTGASPVVQSLTRPDGSVTAYQYDVLNRLTQMTTTVSGVTVSQYAYTYNTQDLRDSEISLDLIPAYADYLANYTYNNVNELTQVADPGSKNLTYDASGNLTAGYTPAGYAVTFTYDGSNRLLTSTYTDGGVVNKTEYYYLGHTLHRRKNYRNGALVTENRYLYDGSLAVQERDKNNNLVNEYTYGLGLPGGIGGLLRLNQSNTAYSYLYDGKGNVTALLNGSTGQVAQTYQYDPFGAPMGGTGSITQPVRFSTKPYDDQTGLSYYGYRFYAPALGRWMTRDPIGEEGGINLYGFLDSVGKPFSGTNLYAFCDNNPVNRIDPWGLWTGSFGWSINIQWGSFNMNFSGGAVIDDLGNFGTYGSMGPGLGAGGKISCGICGAMSNAKCIDDLGGPFFNGNLGGGWGPDVEANFFSGPSANGDVYGGGITVGVGYGAGGSAGITGTRINNMVKLW